jgi:Trypsin
MSLTLKTNSITAVFQIKDYLLLNDIALVLPASATTVTSAQWNTNTNVPPATGTQSLVVVCGFGQIATSGKSSGETSTDELLKVTMTSVDHTTCSDLYNVDSATVFCAGEEGRGICYGDSYVSLDRLRGSVFVVPKTRLVKNLTHTLFTLLVVVVVVFLSVIRAQRRTIVSLWYDDCGGHIRLYCQVLCLVWRIYPGCCLRCLDQTDHLRPIQCQTQLLQQLWKWLPIQHSSAGTNPQVSMERFAIIIYLTIEVVRVDHNVVFHVFNRFAKNQLSSCKTIATTSAP